MPDLPKYSAAHVGLSTGAASAFTYIILYRFRQLSQPYMLNFKA